MYSKMHPICEMIEPKPFKGDHYYYRNNRFIDCYGTLNKLIKNVLRQNSERLCKKKYQGTVMSVNAGHMSPSSLYIYIYIYIYFIYIYTTMYIRNSTP